MLALGVDLAFHRAWPSRGLRPWGTRWLDGLTAGHASHIKPNTTKPAMGFLIMRRLILKVPWGVFGTIIRIGDGHTWVKFIQISRLIRMKPHAKAFKLDCQTGPLHGCSWAPLVSARWSRNGGVTSRMRLQRYISPPNTPELSRTSNALLFRNELSSGFHWRVRLNDTVAAAE
jgi:hypothetical protein